MTLTLNEVFELLKTTDKKFWHMDYFGKCEYLQGYNSQYKNIRGIHYYKTNGSGELVTEIILPSKFLSKFSDPMWKDGWLEYSEDEIFGQTFSPDIDIKKPEIINVEASVIIRPLKCPMASKAICNCVNCKYFNNIYKGLDGLMWVSCNYTKSE